MSTASRGQPPCCDRWSTANGNKIVTKAEGSGCRRLRIRLRETTPEQAIADFMSLLDTFQFWFNIVTP